MGLAKLLFRRSIDFPLEFGFVNQIVLRSNRRCVTPVCKPGGGEKKDEWQAENEETLHTTPQSPVILS